MGTKAKAWALQTRGGLMLKKCFKILFITYLQVVVAGYHYISIVQLFFQFKIQMSQIQVIFERKLCEGATKFHYYKL